MSTIELVKVNEDATQRIHVVTVKAMYAVVRLAWSMTVQLGKRKHERTKKSSPISRHLHIHKRRLFPSLRSWCWWKLLLHAAG